MTTDLFTQYSQLDPASEPDSQPNWDSVGPVLLATIDGGETTMTRTTDTPHDTTRTPTKRTWRGSWIAAAAFAVVIAVGLAIFLIPDSQPPAEDVPAPPFDTPESAAQAFHAGIQAADTASVMGMLNESYVGYDIIGPTAAETGERLRFLKALRAEWALDSCSQNSPTSADCRVEYRDDFFDLIYGGGPILVLTVRIDENGYISSTAMRQHEDTVEPPAERANAWSAWAADNTLPFLEMDPRADSTGQLDKSPEEAAAFLLAEVQRFIDETGS